jgi:hypothetical protein
MPQEPLQFLANSTLVTCYLKQRLYLGFPNFSTMVPQLGSKSFKQILDLLIPKFFPLYHTA